jgi:serine/threonine-protein kinase
VLYEATTGQQPFRGEGEHQVMQELVKGAFAPPSRLVRGYPFELERIVTRALAAQPLHRFQTMEQMRTALEEWISKSGPVVTQSQVAGAVKERLGPEVEKRRERIRAASAAIVERGETFDPSQTTPSGASVRPVATTPSGIVPMREGSTPPPAPGRISHMALTESALLPPVVPLVSRAPSAPQYVIAGAIGVLAAAAVGVAGFYVWRTMTPAPSATPVPAVASTELPTPALPVVRASSAVVPLVPSAIAHAAAPIVFKVIPDKAYFVLDGSAAEPTVRTLDRPAAGATRTLVVRADGYVDQTLTIDESAPTSIDVWLDALPKKSASQAKGPPSDATNAKAPEALPANPY